MNTKVWSTRAWEEIECEFQSRDRKVTREGVEAILRAIENERPNKVQLVQAFRLRYGFSGEAPLLYREVAERMNLSESRVRDMVEEIKRRMHHPSMRRLIDKLDVSLSIDAIPDDTSVPELLREMRDSMFAGLQAKGL